MIEGVTFDWWNTIALTTEDQDRRLRELRIERLLRTAGSRSVTRDALLRAYDHQTALLREAWSRNVDLEPEEQVRLFLEAAGLDGRDGTLARTTEDAFGGALLEMPPALFPNVPEALEALTQDGLAVGIVSNTGRTWGRYLSRVQDRLGIGRHFAVRIFSDEVGVRKPEARIFRAALERLDLPPERVVHIGDDVAADVVGAKGAGMQAIWFDARRPGHRPGYGTWSEASKGRADAVIHDHADLPAVMTGWRP